MNDSIRQIMNEFHEGEKLKVRYWIGGKVKTKVTEGEIIQKTQSGIAMKCDYPIFFKYCDFLCGDAKVVR